MDYVTFEFFVESTSAVVGWVVHDLGLLSLHPVHDFVTTPPDLPHPDGTTCPGAHFTISPDQQWIFADEKLYHKANEVWLLHRDSELHYSLVGEPTFGRAALAYYMRVTGKRVPSDYYFITRIGPWPNVGSRIRLTLYSAGWLDIALCYDFQNRTFSISDDQTTTYY